MSATFDPIAAIKDRLSKIPYAQTLGMEPQFMGEEFTLVMPFQQSNIGNATLPALHGGGIGGFMEMCAISQLILDNPNRDLPRPIGINIDYLRRGNPVDTYARAQIFKQDRSLAYGEYACLRTRGVAHMGAITRGEHVRRAGGAKRRIHRDVSSFQIERCFR